MSAINLKPKDETFILPNATAPDEVFSYIATFNSWQYFDVDSNGLNTNDVNGIYLANYLTQSSFDINRNQMLFNGLLFLGLPSGYSTDVNNENGQYQTITKDLMNKAFFDTFKKYIYCNFEVNLTSIKPLYNSVKYAKAIESTGVEISYQIWI